MTTHTSEPVDNCGCRLERTPNGLHMQNCSLHAAASDLLAMLIELRDAARAEIVCPRRKGKPSIYTNRFLDANGKVDTIIARATRQ